jgi:glycosyltransferase involved in cell wall biosynthesis
LSEPRLSVCIVTGRRTDLLDACLASLQAQKSPPPFELLVAADRDATVAATVQARFPDAAIAAVERSFPGAARNVLMERARGDWLVFLDDDVTFAPSMLRRLAELTIAHPEAMVIGGPNETPPKSSRFQIVQGAVLASAVASGPVRRRYGAHPEGEADERWFILCNLAVRRTAMVPFAPDLVCAEENAVLSELSERGFRMHYDPKLVVFHERRPSLRGFAQQMHKYGRGRGQLVRRDPSSVRLPFLVPTGLVAYLLALPLLVALWSPVAAVPLAIYLVAVLAGAAWIAKTLRRWRDLPLASVLIATVHLAYGTGVVSGVFRRTRRGPYKPPRSRWLDEVEVERS